jgi:hypothetical protein
MLGSRIVEKCFLIARPEMSISTLFGFGQDDGFATGETEVA